MQALFDHLYNQGALTLVQRRGITLRLALAELPRITTTETAKPIKPWHGHSGKGHTAKRRAIARSHHPVHQTRQRSHYFQPRGG